MTKFAAALAFLLCASVLAQDFPTRPVRLVVGFVPGGGADNAARAVALRLTDTWGQSVIVDNRAGAGGNVATEIVSKSAPDGYTLLVSSPGPIVINPYLYAKLAYNPEQDLTPITQIASGPNALVVRPTAPVSSVKELIEWARNTPSGLNYASSGIGTTPHLSGELFKMAAHVNMVHVAYKSAGPAVIDLIGNRVDLMIVSIPSVLSQIKAGRLKALAVTSLKKSSVLPDLPTVSESGLPGYETVTWWGLFAPGGMRASLAAKIHQEVANSLGSAEMKEALARDGVEGVGNSPAEFRKFLKAESTKWAKVIKTSGIKAE